MSRKIRPYESITAPFPADEEKPYLFVSYSHRDRRRVFAVLKELYENGWRLWYDEGLEIGDQYDEVLRSHEKECAGILLFLTSNSVHSCYINQYELPQAMEFGKKIVVCHLDEGEAFDSFDLSAFPETDEEHLEKVLEEHAPEARGWGREAKPRQIRVSPAVAAKDSDYEFGRCSGGVRLLRYRGTDTVVHVPEEYPPESGLKVVETMMTFFDHDKIKEVHFPPTLKTIGKATFGCVYLPGEKTHVYIPSSVTGFEENWCGVININPVQKQLFFHCAKGSAAFSVGSARPFVTVIEDGSMAVKERPEMKTYAFCSYAGEKGKELARILRSKDCRLICGSEAAKAERDRLIRGGACFIAFADREYMEGEGVEELRRAYALDKKISLYFLDDAQLPGDLEKLSEQHSLKYDAGSEEERTVRLVNWLSANGCRELSQIDNFEYIVEDGGLILTKYTGGPHAVIEEEYGGFPVTAIFPEAFKNCRQLQSVKIPDGVESIGDEAFSGCSSLDSVELPGSVTEIGTEAFFCCSSLSNVRFSEGLETVGRAAFSYCNCLAVIELPSSTKRIFDHAFSSCKGLRRLIIPYGVRELGPCMVQRCSGLRELVIPGSVEKISRLTFAGPNGLRKVILQEGVKEIEESAFLDAGELEYVELPESAGNVAEKVFAGCSSLRFPFVSENILGRETKAEKLRKEMEQTEQETVSEEVTKIMRIRNPLRLMMIALDTKQRYSMPEREAAIGQIRMQALLEHILKKSRILGIQIAAVKAMTSQSMLEQVARGHGDCFVRMAAIEKLENETVIREIALSDEDGDARVTALKRTKDRDTLLRIANQDAKEHVRLAALEQLGDAELFRRLISGTESGARRLALVKRISGQKLLEELALHDTYTLVREAAVQRLTGRELLEKIATEDEEPWIREAASDRLSEL